MKTYRQSKFLNPWVMFLTGMAIGVASRLFDIYFVNLGELFSQMAIWILIGTLISIYSPTRKAAMLNIFPFCIAMLLHITQRRSSPTEFTVGRSYSAGPCLLSFPRSWRSLRGRRSATVHLQSSSPAASYSLLPCQASFCLKVCGFMTSS